jgi:hypothetical protein
MTCVATRQQRLDNFRGGGEPPAGEPVELPCEDNSGTKDVGIFEVSALEADLEGVDRAMHYSQGSNATFGPAFFLKSPH